MDSNNKKPIITYPHPETKLNKYTLSFVDEPEKEKAFLDSYFDNSFKQMKKAIFLGEST